MADLNVKPGDPPGKKDRSGPGVTENYDGRCIGGTKHGSFDIGRLNNDGVVEEGPSVNTNDGVHRMYTEIYGERKGNTTFIGPGSFNVSHGRDRNSDNDVSVSIVAQDGNIFINASDGDIIMEADNISLVARHGQTDKGNITLTATENISNNSKKFLVNASNTFKIATSGKGDVIANSILNCYGSIFQAVDDSCAVKPSKNGGILTVLKNTIL